MSEDTIVYLTEEGYQKIQEELEYLKGPKRNEISKKLQEAIAMGDLSENADYAYAKQEQAFMEGRILELEDSLRRAQIIANNGKKGVVSVGSTVTVVEEDYDDEETYRIVGIHEADPSNGLISNESPMGRALLGAKVGHKIKVETPGGLVTFVVKKIG
ncbi:MAG: transcription elongation factor GreA [Anaerolineae bacterium]|nr:transcription elongation factor GreA [Anaerolineae bacterium]